MKKSKKNDKLMHCKCMSITVVVFILVIIALVIVAGSLSGSCKKPVNNIAVSIDKDGNVYDGNNKFLGKLGDENVTFYDDSGKLIGTATFNIN
jgi:hypothetical protein